MQYYGNIFYVSVIFWEYLYNMCNILGISLCVCGISLYVCNMRCWLSVILYPSVTGPHPFSSCSQGDDITITTPFLLNISLTIDIMILKQPHDMQKILHQPHPFSSCSQQDDITMTTSFLLLLILLLLLLQ